MESSATPVDTLAEAYLLALQLRQSGDIRSAIEACRIILQAKPLQPETLLLLGVCHWQLGELVQALAVLDLALHVQPGWPDAHFNRGLVLRGLGRAEEAVASYRRVIEANPCWAEAHDHLANALLDLGRVSEAITAFKEAARCDPGFVEAHFNLGHTLQEAGRLDEALSAYEEVITLQPDHSRALNNCGLVLLDMGRAEQALASFDRAIAQQPDHAKAYNNRGNALVKLRRIFEALESYEHALSLDPSYAEAYYNRGNALQEILRFDEAIACYEQAEVLRPDYADAHWNEGLCRLVRGDFSAGWKKYEWRWKLRSNQSHSFNSGNQLTWSGVESLQGRTVLLYAEQGMGDTLQFCRYAARVAALGAKVLLEVQPSLKPLLGKLEGTLQVLATGDERPPYDFSCSLLSLPGIFGTDLASIPGQVPYLQCDAAKRAHWETRLGRKTRKRVGLAWSGSPTHKRDDYRSIPLAMFRELLGFEDIEFISLQPEVRDTDNAVLRESNIRDVRSDIRDFSDTAALVSLLDLVICVDTSVAHLAGALGQPVWILLPLLPDWRWLLDREDSPWYPTARLFRQTEESDWTPVVAQVVAELAALLA